MAVSETLLFEGRIGYFWRNGVDNRDDQGLNSLLSIEKTIRSFIVTLRWESGPSADYFAVRDSGFSTSWSLNVTSPTITVINLNWT